VTAGHKSLAQVSPAFFRAVYGTGMQLIKSIILKQSGTLTQQQRLAYPKRMNPESRLQNASGKSEFFASLFMNTLRNLRADILKNGMSLPK
jgi:hypothetical protein